MSSTVAIYARISLDHDDDETGVARQQQACQTWAAEQGYTVAGLYVDNSISASTGKPRAGSNGPSTR